MYYDTPHLLVPPVLPPLGRPAPHLPSASPAHKGMKLEAKHVSTVTSLNIT
jgi:hypothetical protein